MPGMNYTHRQNIFLRISFLSTLTDNAKASYDSGILQKLWENLVLIPEDRRTIEAEIFFTWLKGLITRKKIGKEVIS